MVRRKLVWLLVFLAAPRLAPAESWAALGLRDTEDPPIQAKLARAREVLAGLVPAGDRVLSGEEIANGLRLPTVSAAGLESVLAEAELLFFQLEHGAAEAKLEEALASLSRDRDEIPAELGRGLRLLLALVQLQGGDREGAAATLRPLAALSPLPDSIRPTTPEAVVALWDEVRAAASLRAEGWLVVDCTGCHGGEVWLEGRPMGTTQQSIGLAPGAYRLVLRGVAGAEARRSLAREVRIRSGEETRLRIDLAAEAALIGEDGPSLPAGEEAPDRAAYLAELLGVDRLLLWRFPAGGDHVEVWEAGARERRGPWTRAAGEEELEETVAALARELLGAGRATDRDAGEVAEAPPFVQQERRASWRPAAKWATLGATAALVGAATWLSLDTASGKAELDRLDGRGAYRSVQEARRADQLAASIEARRTWGTVLWAGAAAGAVGTLLLFLDEAEAPGAAR